MKWNELLDHLIAVEGECMEENYGKGRALNASDEECNAGIRRAYASLKEMQPVLEAAPDLLSALRLGMEWCENDGYPDDHCMVSDHERAFRQAARAAIAKAEGQ